MKAKKKYFKNDSSNVYRFLAYLTKYYFKPLKLGVFFKNISQRKVYG